MTGHVGFLAKLPVRAILDGELEGVVAKRRSGRYLAGARGWIKTKNRNYWRYEMEREGGFKIRRGQFV